MSTYRSLLRIPGARTFFFTAAAGRVGIAMTATGLVWFVHARTGSYAVAGLVAGAFAIAETLAGPLLARLIDRLGQPRVLRPAMVAHTVAVLCLLAAGSNTWLLAAAGALVGATIPQLGALSAARWTSLLPPAPPPSAIPPSTSPPSATPPSTSPPTATPPNSASPSASLPTAFALESLANAIAYLAGPSIVSLIAASGYPPVGVVVAATLIVLAGFGLAMQRRTAPAIVGTGAVRASRSLLSPSFVVIVALNLAIGGFFGSMRISVTAFADSAAVLFVASNCASALAGWLYGMRRWTLAPQAQLAIAAVSLAASTALVLLAETRSLLATSLVLTGAFVPIILVLCSLLTERAVHRGALTQAFTWLNSASAAGSAASAALAGSAVDTAGAHAGFIVAVTSTCAIAALAATALAIAARARPSTSHVSLTPR